MVHASSTADTKELSDHQSNEEARLVAKDAGKHRRVLTELPICNALKPLRGTKGTRRALERPQLFQIVSLDLVGPRQLNGEKWQLLIIIDHYSRYMTATALKSATAHTVVEAFKSQWVAKFGAPLAVLTDRGSRFTAEHFKNFVTKGLSSKLYFASTEYPQGNGINESAHRIVELSLKTRWSSTNVKMQELLDDAALLHNVTPNKSIGDTPASLTFGTDLHLPGLGAYEETKTEEARLHKLQDNRWRALVRNQLEEIEPGTIAHRELLKEHKLKVGDIVTYRLSVAEARNMWHVTGENSYTAIRSLPQRVVKIKDHAIYVEPLWTEGPQRQVPEEEVKLIATFIPDLQREETRKLFPGASWIPTTIASAKVNPCAGQKGETLPKDMEDELIEVNTSEDEAKDPEEEGKAEPTLRKKRARVNMIDSSVKGGVDL